MLVLAMQFSSGWGAQKAGPRGTGFDAAAHPENGRDDGRRRFGGSRGGTEVREPAIDP